METIPNPGSGDKYIDLTGLLCPIPVVKVSEILTDMALGELLEVVADDQGVKADFPALCKSIGSEFVGYLQEGTIVRSFIRKGRG